ncbi:MAG: 16S rRNA (adenine(1518)-N(6)/adenine(1519)-N(6))-dimethyltransferase RsmA [Atribacterota bacterium]
MRRKRLGQHFLVDAAILERIVSAGELSPQDLVLEVGVGKGVLTERLAQHAGWVVGIEIDSDLFTYAQERLKTLTNVVLVKEDVLKIDFPTLLSPFKAERRKCIANLPYGISTPFFFRFLESTPQVQWERFVVMVQYEFGEKLLSLPPQGKGNPLSIGIAKAFSVERLCVVPPSSFWPNPKVYSLLLCGKRRPEIREDFPDFLRFVTRVFRSRRKILKNLIPEVTLPEEIARKRAEDLTPEEWGKLWARVRVAL